MEVVGVRTKNAEKSCTPVLIPLQHHELVHQLSWQSRDVRGMVSGDQVAHVCHIVPLARVGVTHFASAKVLSQQLSTTRILQDKWSESQAYKCKSGTSTIQELYLSLQYADPHSPNNLNRQLFSQI